MFIYLRPKVLAVVVLGFVSGLPLALTASTLTAMLTEYGVNIALVGAFAMVGVPYSLKFLWSPVIDNLKIPYLSKVLGRRKGWLILVQIMLILAIISMGIIDPGTQISWLALAAFVVAFLSATQDIIIDAFRIELLKDNEQGAGATAIIFGYRLGILVASAGALTLAHYYSWQFAYFVMALILLPGIAIAFICKEPGIAYNKQVEHLSLKWLEISFIQPFIEFLKRKQSLLILIFVILYKLSDAYVGMLTTPFLLKIGFSKLEIASIVKTYGLVATLLGVFLGGYLVEKIGMKKSLIIGGILQILSNLAFLIQYKAGHDNTVLLAVISVENFTGGIGTAAFVAYLSNLCNLNFTATQYALLSSFATFARTTLSSSSGVTAEFLGWNNFFIFSSILSIPAIIMLRYIAISKRPKTAIAKL